MARSVTAVPELPKRDFWVPILGTGSRSHPNPPRPTFEPMWPHPGRLARRRSAQIACSARVPLLSQSRRSPRPLPPRRRPRCCRRRPGCALRPAEVSADPWRGSLAGGGRRPVPCDFSPELPVLRRRLPMAPTCRWKAYPAPSYGKCWPLLMSICWLGLGKD